MTTIQIEKFNLEAFKEPRGFIKIFQLLFAIIGFGIVVNYSGSFTFNVQCNPKEHVNVTEKFYYPFRIDRIKTKKVCGKEDLDYIGDFSSDSQFFVATGVLAMLYCLFISVVYVVYNETYGSINWIPITDFVVTAVLGLLYLASSAAWANSVSLLKTATDPSTYFKSWDICIENCRVISLSRFASLNISIIIGFLNLILWVSNLWFLFKETPWFQPSSNPPDTSNVNSQQTGGRWQR